MLRVTRETSWSPPLTSSEPYEAMLEVENTAPS